MLPVISLYIIDITLSAGKIYLYITEGSIENVGSYTNY